MKYLSFILSLSSINFTLVVFFFLIVSTIFEYLFVVSVPFLLNIVFINDNSYSVITFFKNFDKQTILKIVFFLILIFFVLKNIFYFLNQFFFLKYSFNIHNKLSYLLFTKYLNDKYLVFLNSKSSELLKNVKDNTDLVRQMVGNFLTFFSELLVFFGLCFIVIYKSTLISIFSIIFIILFSFLYLYFTRNLSIKWSIKRQSYESSKIQYLQESFLGFKELKIFNKENLFIKNYNQKNNDANLMNFKFNLLYTLPRVYLEIVGALGLIVLIVLNLGKGDKNFFISTIPLLSLYFVVFIRLLPSVNRILNSVETNRFAFPAYKIIFKDLNSFSNNHKSTVKIINFNNRIIFKNVDFHFSKSSKILNNINIEIKKGEKIGIIGDSGVGKTTLVNLLSGLLEPTKGSILCDGINIQKDIKLWQKKIAYISQSTFLMNDTIENNISFNSTIDPNHSMKIKKVIKLIKLNNVINKLSKRLETIVGDEGSSRLSGGQIQKLAIARALYFDREILICDEITSSLDNNSEKSIISCLKKLNKTIIIISHKIENLKFCSKIYKIKNKNLFLI